MPSRFEASLGSSSTTASRMHDLGVFKGDERGCYLGLGIILSLFVGAKVAELWRLGFPPFQLALVPRFWLHIDLLFNECSQGKVTSREVSDGLPPFFFHWFGCSLYKNEPDRAGAMKTNERGSRRHDLGSLWVQCLPVQLKGRTTDACDSLSLFSNRVSRPSHVRDAVIGMVAWNLSLGNDRVSELRSHRTCYLTPYSRQVLNASWSTNLLVIVRSSFEELGRNPWKVTFLGVSEAFLEEDSTKESEPRFTPCTEFWKFLRETELWLLEISSGFFLFP
ncbi:hypothetical protein VNO77_19452 [Canavalia gladiata]|uniref:Uncharacterized protein n=1 Tax=Canavalia gladiata TaxID=3824 RepID=A0AAN9LMI9_CANGL